MLVVSQSISFLIDRSYVEFVIGCKVLSSSVVERTNGINKLEKQRVYSLSFDVRMSFIRSSEYGVVSYRMRHDGW